MDKAQNLEKVTNIAQLLDTIPRVYDYIPN